MALGALKSDPLASHFLVFLSGGVALGAFKSDPLASHFCGFLGVTNLGALKCDPLASHFIGSFGVTRRSEPSSVMAWLLIA